VRRSLDWLLESGNEPGPAGVKAGAPPGSRHATISSVSPEPGWPDASAGAGATVHSLADVDACNQSHSQHGVASRGSGRREPGLPGRQPISP
jgi:hypothetical protein